MKNLFIAVLMVIFVAPFANATPAFVQANGSTSQCLMAGVPELAVMDQVDDIHDITPVGTTTFKVVESGNYVIIAAPQIMAHRAYAEFNCWLTVNGADVPNSNVEYKFGDYDKKKHKKHKCRKKCDDGKKTPDGMPDDDIHNTPDKCKKKKCVVEKDVIVTQTVIYLEAGDEVSVKVATDKDFTCLEAITNDGQPLVPSIIFSMFHL